MLITNSESWENTVAAYKFVETMVDRANDFFGSAPLWHGWALREAFIEGIKHHASQQVVEDGQAKIVEECPACGMWKNGDNVWHSPDLSGR